MTRKHNFLPEDVCDIAGCCGTLDSWHQLIHNDTSSLRNTTAYLLLIPVLCLFAYRPGL